jgi:hypothetical protein
MHNKARNTFLVYLVVNNRSLPHRVTFHLQELDSIAV